MIVGLVVAARLEAQGPTDPHAVQPERPTVATHAGLVARGWLEIETGVERDRLLGATSLSVPTVLKMGLTRRTQLNLGLPMAGPSGERVGPGDLSVGIKWRLADELPILREFAVLPAVKFSTGSFDRGAAAFLRAVRVRVLVVLGEFGDEEPAVLVVVHGDRRTNERLGSHEFDAEAGPRRE